MDLAFVYCFQKRSLGTLRRVAVEDCIDCIKLWPVEQCRKKVETNRNPKRQPPKERGPQKVTVEQATFQSIESIVRHWHFLLERTYAVPLPRSKLSPSAYVVTVNKFQYTSEAYQCHVPAKRTKNHASVLQRPKNRPALLEASWNRRCFFVTTGEISRTPANCCRSPETTRSL